MSRGAHGLFPSSSSSTFPCKCASPTTCLLKEEPEGVGRQESKEMDNSQLHDWTQAFQNKRWINTFQDGKNFRNLTSIFFWQIGIWYLNSLRFPSKAHYSTLAVGTKQRGISKSPGEGFQSTHGQTPFKIYRKKKSYNMGILERLPKLFWNIPWLRSTTI